MFFLFNAVIFWFHVNFQGCTPQKTDIVAENGWLEDESLFGVSAYSGKLLSSGRLREVKQMNMIWIMYDPNKTPAVCSEFKCVMTPMPEQELCSPIRRDIGTLYRFDGVMNLCISNPADKHIYYLPLECPPRRRCYFQLKLAIFKLETCHFPCTHWHPEHFNTKSWLRHFGESWPGISRSGGGCCIPWYPGLTFWAISPIISASSWYEKFHWSYLFQVASMLRFVFLWHHQRQLEVTVSGSITYQPLWFHWFLQISGFKLVIRIPLLSYLY